MAQNGNATPQGRQRDWGLLGLGLMVAVFLGIVVGGYLIARSLEPSVTYVSQTYETPKVAPVSNIEPALDVDDHPAVPSGTGAWAEYRREALNRPEMIGAMTDPRLHPNFQPQQLDELIWLESQGWDFVVWVPAGSTVVNTGYREGRYFVTKPYSLKEGRWGLVDLEGRLLVLESCGNAARLVKLGPAEKPTRPQPTKPKPDQPQPEPERPRKPLRNDDPTGRLTPHHPANDTYLDPPSPGPTRGANPPEVIEEIAQDQETRVPGGREPTPYGTDSGAETNPTNSRTENPDGSYTDAVIGDEVEITPPSDDTATGTIDPDSIP